LPKDDQSDTINPLQNNDHITHNDDGLQETNDILNNDAHIHFTSSMSSMNLTSFNSFNADNESDSWGKSKKTPCWNSVIIHLTIMMNDFILIMKSPHFMVASAGSAAKTFAST
jgi:hypothetical protein